jgi:hypothetical protein
MDKLIQEYNATVDRVSCQLELFKKAEHDLVELEAYDATAFMIIKNRGFYLQEISAELDDLGYKLRLIADKLEKGGD